MEENLLVLYTSLDIPDIAVEYLFSLKRARERERKQLLDHHALLAICFMIFAENSFGILIEEDFMIGYQCVANENDDA